MGVYQQIETAMQNRDIDAFMHYYHDDYQFVSHKDGSVMSKEQFHQMAQGLMSSDKLQTHNDRCLYENDDIMVSHSIMDFPDGSTEAVMAVHMMQDGKVIRTETGATLLSRH